eukprot:CAMPEP_0174719758 /NCGR_PEP_ID=MMETSP1094-20130205/31909_1 /TAXON_ID=156173 /ORGANISM="Chrysochromulina brevifilum, Strain UTEX LB 985" /LENGTH=133 /DNA_ID=CAMNT_0015920121 /DNA_START=237 /DNA_END=639 /DNA_ORIENTATION=-
MLDVLPKDNELGYHRLLAFFEIGWDEDAKRLDVLEIDKPNVGLRAAATCAAVKSMSCVGLSDLAESKSRPTLFTKRRSFDGPESFGAVMLIADTFTADMNLRWMSSSSSASDCKKELASSRSPSPVPRQCRSV